MERMVIASVKHKPLAVADSRLIALRGFAIRNPVGSLFANTRTGHGCQIIPRVPVALHDAYALSVVTSL